MTASLSRALLLVALWGAIAHARHLPSGAVAQPAVTLLSTAGVVRGGPGSNNDNDDDDGGGFSRRSVLSLDEDVAVVVRLPSSVVQDWSLVCQQLCGAGLGGAPCVAHCDTSDTPSLSQAANADALLSSNKDAICQDLCRLQLGDATCNCAIANNNQSSAASNAASADLTVAERNEVCSSFCDRTTAVLAGCSLCNDGRTTLLDAAATATSEYTSPATEAIASDDGAGAGGSAGMSARTTAAPQTTTPHWGQLCTKLCKTNDGGSLCNCDLAPFS